LQTQNSDNEGATKNQILYDPYEEVELEEPVIDLNAPIEQYKTIKVIDDSDRHRPASSVA